MFNTHINRKIFNFVGLTIKENDKNFIKIINSLNHMNDGFYKQNLSKSKHFNIYESLHPIVIDNKVFNIVIEINHKHNSMYMVNKNNKFIVN